MPYIVTTTKSREAYERRRAADPGAYRNQGVARRAVATLDEADAYVSGLVGGMLPWPSNPDASHAAATQIRDLTAEGGSIGPLPDGTTITVERVEPNVGASAWQILCSQAGLRLTVAYVAENPCRGDRAEAQREIVAAWNEEHGTIPAESIGEALYWDGVTQCERHPGTVWPHGDCPGPGMPLRDAPGAQEGHHASE